MEDKYIQVLKNSIKTIRTQGAHCTNKVYYLLANEYLNCNNCQFRYCTGFGYNICVCDEKHIKLLR